MSDRNLGRPDLVFVWCATHKAPMIACIYRDREDCKSELRFVGPRLKSTTEIPLP